MAKFFCEIGGYQVGPFESNELKEMARTGKLRASDLVWKENTTQRVAAGRVKDLFEPETSAAVEPVLKDDPGPVKILGNSGMACATPKAIYLVKAPGGGRGGGIAGELISLALDGYGGKDDTRTCAMSELPAAIQAVLDRKRKKQAQDVIVLPKEAVSLVKFGKIESTIRITCGGQKFLVITSWFKRDLMQFMTENDWTINRPVTPSISPIHGHNFGRDQSTPAPKQLGLFWRILVLMAGIAVFLGGMCLVEWLKIRNGSW